MSKKGKAQASGEILDAVALFPWWVGAGLGLALYVLFHALASPRDVRTLQYPQQAAEFAVAAILRAVAGVFQYVLPLLCLLGSLSGWLNRSKRAERAKNVAAGASAAILYNMTWLEFELLVGESFRQRGFKVLKMGGDQADGGVDLVVQKDEGTFLVQCKQWKAQRVGVRVVRELAGVMSAQGAKGGFVVTSGSYTSEAEWFARDCNIQLINGEALFGMLKEAQSKLHEGALPSSRRRADPSAPNCPVCGSAMRKREARRGKQPGNLFWGCSAYPRCLGTRGDSQRGALI